jgi:hypothetical protein
MLQELQYLAPEFGFIHFLVETDAHRVPFRIWCFVPGSDLRYPAIARSQNKSWRIESHTSAPYKLPTPHGTPASWIYQRWRICWANYWLRSYYQFMNRWNLWFEKL